MLKLFGLTSYPRSTSRIFLPATFGQTQLSISKGILTKPTSVPSQGSKGSLVLNKKVRKLYGL